LNRPSKVEGQQKSNQNHYVFCVNSVRRQLAIVKVFPTDGWTVSWCWCCCYCK